MRGDFDIRTELVNKNKEIIILKERIFNSEKMLDELESKLERRDKGIDDKIKINSLLMEIVGLKKSEVQFLEALKYTDSNALKDNLVTIRVKEKEILKQ